MVSTIFAYGEDALNTEASITLQLPSFLRLDDLDGALTFRATGFKTPEVEIKTFTQNYRGYQVERWKPGRDARTTDVTFRIDRYWRVYDALYDWSNQIVNLETGSSYIDPLSKTDTSVGTILASAMGLGVLDSLRGTMSIVQETSTGDIVGKGWTYYGVWPKVIPSIDFDTSSDGTPITVTVTFGYSYFKRS